MTTTISRFAVVTLICLSFLANICIADTQPYIIYPKPNINQAESDDLSNTISLISAQRYHYTRWEKTIPEFWVAWFTPAAYIRIRNDPRIREIHLSKVLAEPAVSVESTSFNNSSPVEAPSEVEADTSAGSNPSYTTQISPRATELRLLSQPPGPVSWSRYKNYVYKTGGIQTYIYHAELGVTPGLDVSKSRIEWLYTPEAYFWGQATPGESTVPGLPLGHSTCTASKAAGIGYGAAKEATLVVVKMLDYSEPSLVSVFKVIADDVKQKGRGGRSVVSVSWTTMAAVGTIGDDTGLMEMDNALKELYDNNVIVVCSAGNFALTPGITGSLRDRVDTAPAVFLDRVITVGASYFNGRRWEASQTLIDRPQIYAPGVGIVCADASGKVPYRVETGTSFSAPLVAGIIAGLLALGKISFPLVLEQLTDYLYNQASWQRGGNGQYVIWNQVDIGHNEPNLTASFLETNGPGDGKISGTTD